MAKEELSLRDYLDAQKEYFDAKFEGLDKRLENIEVDIDAINAQHQELSKTIFSMDGKMDLMIPLFQDINGTMSSLAIGGGLTVAAAVVGSIIVMWRKA